MELFQINPGSGFTEVKECSVLLPTLIEDDAEATRLFACSVVESVATTYTCLIDTNTLHTLADSKFFLQVTKVP